MEAIKKAHEEHKYCPVRTCSKKIMYKNVKTKLKI